MQITTCRGLSNYHIFGLFKRPGGMYKKMAEKLLMLVFRLFPTTDLSCRKNKKLNHQ